MAFFVVLHFSRIGITKAPVFPVPFLALARIDLPPSATGRLSSWIGEGFSYPISKIPMRSSRFLRSHMCRSFQKGEKKLQESCKK